MRKCLLISLAGVLLLGCARDPEVEINDPSAPRVRLEVLSRIAAEVSIDVPIAAEDFTYGAEIVKIVDGEESSSKLSFKSKELDGNRSFTWTAYDLQPNSTYIARSYFTNGRNRKNSERFTFTTPSTSKATLSAVSLDGDLLTASIMDDGGRSIAAEDVGFVAGDTPDRKELLRKEKNPANVVEGNSFSLPMDFLSEGKTYYIIAYATDDQEDTGYSSSLLKVSLVSLTIDREEVSIEEGGTVTLLATVMPEDAPDKAVTWTSSNTSVATVEGGFITAIKEGTTVITAAAGGKKVSCNVTVAKKIIAVTEVIFDKTSLEMVEGDEYSLSVTVNPDDATDKTVTWTSFNADVATVENGLVIAKGEGVTTVTASAGGKSASCAITVTQKKTDVPINDECFPDAVFREYVSSQFDTNHDGSLSDDEANAVSEISLERMGVESLTGIEIFKSLSVLRCQYNKIQNIDVSSNLILQELLLEENQLSSIDVSNNIHLTKLWCGFNSIRNIDLSNNTDLKELSVQYDEMDELDLSHNTKLQTVHCDGCNLPFLNLSNLLELQVLSCGGNQFNSLDVSNNPELYYLSCFPCFSLTSLDVSKNPKLTHLYCTYNSIEILDISNNPNLESLDCSAGLLTNLDVSKNPRLTYLVCGDNRLTQLDVSNNLQLERIHCNDNKLSALNLSKNTHLKDLAFSNNPIFAIDISNNIELEWLGFQYTSLSKLDVHKNLKLDFLRCTNNPYLAEVWLNNGQTIATFEYDDSITTLRYYE